MPLPVDLTHAQATVESFMVDTCEIRYDPEGHADDDFDPADWSYERTPGDDTLVYSGPCGLSAGSASDTTDAQRPRARSEWTLKLPLGTVVPPGSVVTITASERNPALVDETFRTRKALSGTLSVLVRIPLEADEPTVEEQADR